MRITLTTLIWTAVIIALVVTGWLAIRPRPIRVEVVEVIEGPLKVTVQEDGKTRNREKYVVSAPVSGRLSRIGLDAGDPIEGEKSLLAVILPNQPPMLDARAEAEAKARLHAAEASAERAKVALEEAKINFELTKNRFERAEELLARRALSQDEFDLARSIYLASVQAQRKAEFDQEIARFELETVKATLSQFSDPNLDANFEPFEIFAPVSGNVLRLFQESATVVTQGTPLMEVGDPENLELEIDVLSTDAVRISPGAEVLIEHWGGEMPLRGVVRVVEPAAFTKISSLGVEEQRVNVIVDFDEPPYRFERLGDGYRVEAAITVEQLQKAVQVPNSALFRDGRKWYVFKLVAGRAVRQPVMLGIQNEVQTQVLQGVQPGDQVVVYPSDQIADGTRVVPVEPEPAEESATE